MTLKEKISAVTATDEQYEALMTEICEHRCVKPDEAANQDELDEICEARPVEKLLDELLKAERTKATADVMLIVAEELLGKKQAGGDKPRPYGGD